MNTCPTCTRAAATPFRSHDGAGHIVQGCIDAFHTESLTGVTNSSSAWHFRPVAKKHRAAVAKHLKSL